MELLCLIIIISIAFGISLHDAFWGIVIFAIGVVLFMLISPFLFIAYYNARTKANNALNKLLRTPSPIEKEHKKAERKNKLKDGLITLMFWAYMILPWFLAILFSTTLKETTEQHDWLWNFVILPYAVPLLFIGVMWVISCINKKRTRK